MLKVLKYFLWLLVVLLLAGGLDQAMVRVPLNAPVLQQVQAFYVDFRDRLVSLGGDGTVTVGQPQTIDAVIEKTTKPQSKPIAETNRYLYVDDSGTLQFADSLVQVPQKYRPDAQPLAE